MAGQQPIAAEQLAKWRAEATALDALEQRGNARRALVSVVDVDVVLSLLGEIDRLRYEAGKAGTRENRTSELTPPELGALRREESIVRAAFEVAEAMGDDREHALIRTVDALATALLGARLRGLEKLSDPATEVTNTELAAILAKSETEPGSFPGGVWWHAHAPGRCGSLPPGTAETQPSCPPRGATPSTCLPAQPFAKGYL
jgi:hypothetical protein